MCFRLTPYEWENPHPCVEEPEELENVLTLHNCFWHNWGSLMQQGSDIAPKYVVANSPPPLHYQECNQDTAIRSIRQLEEQKVSKSNRATRQLEMG
jgi:hypothetical protein